MTPLAGVLESLERSRAGLREALDLVPSPLRDRAPTAGRWSAAEVVEHLALVEERYGGILAAGIAGVDAAMAGADAHEAADLPPTVGAMLADRGARRVAPEVVQPAGMACDAAFARLEAARETTCRLLRDADARPWSRIIHEHPRFGALNVFQWGRFLAAHESRHAAQIREIAAQVCP